MYSSSYEDAVSDRMAGLFVGRRPETLIGAPKDTHDLDQQLYANDPAMQARHHRSAQYYAQEGARERHNDSGFTQLPSSTMLMPGLYQKRGPRLQSGLFNRVSDGIALKIFSLLDTPDLLTVSQVCKRFETLCWKSPECWRTITLRGEQQRGDKVLKTIFKRLLLGGPTHWAGFVERVYVSNGSRLTDKSLGLLSRHCPELTHLQVHCCNEIYDSGVTEILNHCTNLQHLDLTGTQHMGSCD